MRELNVNEIEQINGGGYCTTYASLTETAFTIGGGMVGTAFGGIGGLAGAGLGGLIGKWAAGIIAEDCAP